MPELESVDLAQEKQGIKNENKRFRELMKEAKQQKEAAAQAQSTDTKSTAVEVTQVAHDESRATEWKQRIHQQQEARCKTQEPPISS